MVNSRLQVVGSKFTKDGFFSLKKKSSLPGGQLHYSLQRTIGGRGALGLAADLPARVVHAFYIRGMMQVHSLCGKSL